VKHKTTLVSPAYLMAHNIQVNVGVQNAGEFIVTFPGSFHWFFIFILN
jgi:hypothetical protein